MKTFVEEASAYDLVLAEIIDELGIVARESLNEVGEEFWEAGYVTGFGAGYETAVDEIAPLLAKQGFDLEFILKEIHENED